jgi:hypothetical protein
VEGIGIDVS